MQDMKTGYEFLNTAHRKIVEGIIRKAETVCPGSLDLIAVYGSAATGDLHEKSDLDLMILINDEAGRVLSRGFLLDNTGIGYDLYCTTWEMLEEDASCSHAQLSKLLDSRILYAPREEAVSRLQGLREKARAVLSSDARYEKAEQAYALAKRSLGDCFLSDTLCQTRMAAASAIYSLLDAVMLYHGTYFRRGIKRTFEELEALDPPVDLENGIRDVICAAAPDGICRALADLMKKVRILITRPVEQKQPSAGAIRGSYEEMFSNWHGKMYEAARKGQVYASFMNLAALQFMIHEMAVQTGTADQQFLDQFDPLDLEKNERVFDQVLGSYLEEYRKAGLEPEHFRDADEFLNAYLQKE